MTKKAPVIFIIVLFLIICALAIFFFVNAHANKVVLSSDASVKKINKQAENNEGQKLGARSEDEIIGDPRDYHKGLSNQNVFSDLNSTVYFYKKDDSVYIYDATMGFSGVSASAEKLENSDAETFEIIDANYAKDKNNVYGKSDLRLRIADTIIYDADPETFTPLSWPYAKDANHVYYDLIKTLYGADPNTFQVLEYDYLKDKKTVWLKNRKIPDADPESFAIVSERIAKDKNNVYYSGNALTGANPVTFIIIDKVYQKDNDQVWYYDEEIEADVATFESLSKMYYAKDTNSVYYKGKYILDADPISFEFLSYGYAKDNDSVWYDQGKITRRTLLEVSLADTGSFETLARTGCAKDINNYYRNGYVVDSVECK